MVLNGKNEDQMDHGQLLRSAQKVLADTTDEKAKLFFDALRTSRAAVDRLGGALLPSTERQPPRLVLAHTSLHGDCSGLCMVSPNADLSVGRGADAQRVRAANRSGSTVGLLGHATLGALSEARVIIVLHPHDLLIVADRFPEFAVVAVPEKKYRPRWIANAFAGRDVTVVLVKGDRETKFLRQLHLATPRVRELRTRKMFADLEPTTVEQILMNGQQHWRTFSTALQAVELPGQPDADDADDADGDAVDGVIDPEADLASDIVTLSTPAEPAQALVVDDRGDRLDPERERELYTELISQMPLLPHHRQELKTKRGFNTPTITRSRLVSGGNHAFEIVRAVQDACDATDEEMVRAQLLVPRKKDGDLYANGQLLDDALIIPYLDAEGRCYLLRRHKLGFSGFAPELYSAHLATSRGTGDTLIVTEGEFKALALAQMGFRALAVPGISSFGRDHLPRLVNTLEALKLERLVILFDREIKDDPRLASFKEDFRKRHDVDLWAVRTALSLDKGLLGTDVVVARFPDSWMIDGKADCDSALAAGKARADFNRVLADAVPPLAYLDALPAEAAIVVRGKLIKLRAPKEKVLEVHANVYEGHFYDEIIVRKDGTEYRVCSNFLVEPMYLVFTDSGAERLVKLRDFSGALSAPKRLAAHDLQSPNLFTKWAAHHGPYSWSGGRNAMGAVSRLLDAAGDHAARRGARILEGYPVQPNSAKAPDAFLWTGTPSAFERAGFTEVLRRSNTRPIMRKALSRPPRTERGRR